MNLWLIVLIGATWALTSTVLARRRAATLNRLVDLSLGTTELSSRVESTSVKMEERLNLTVSLLDQKLHEHEQSRKAGSSKGRLSRSDPHGSPKGLWSNINFVVGNKELRSPLEIPFATNLVTKRSLGISYDDFGMPKKLRLSRPFFIRIHTGEEDESELIDLLMRNLHPLEILVEKPSAWRKKMLNDKSFRFLPADLFNSVGLTGQS